MTIKPNEMMQTSMSAHIIEHYQDDSILQYFPSVDIGDIGEEVWLHDKIDDISDASLTNAGFNPNTTKLNIQNFGDYVFTASLKMTVGEKDWAKFSKRGYDKKGVGMFGKKVGQMASRYTFRGTDGEGNIPRTQYNYFRDAGTGNGALDRPIINETATSGVWSTYANKAEDLSQLMAALIDKGYNPATTIVFYPRVAHKAMNKQGNAANDLSAKKYLTEVEGVAAVLPLDNTYMYTAAGATPTAILFDLYAIDTNEIEIGYTRHEKVDIDVYKRHVEVEAEVWFCPYKEPLPFSDGKIYSGISRITAIVPA